MSSYDTNKYYAHVYRNIACMFIFVGSARRLCAHVGAVSGGGIIAPLTSCSNNIPMRTCAHCAFARMLAHTRADMHVGRKFHRPHLLKLLPFTDGICESNARHGAMCALSNSSPPPRAKQAVRVRMNHAERNASQVSNANREGECLRMCMRMLGAGGMGGTYVLRAQT